MSVSVGRMLMRLTRMVFGKLIYVTVVKSLWSKKITGATPKPWYLGMVPYMLS